MQTRVSFLRTLVLAPLVVAAVFSSRLSASQLLVSNNNDSGPGSLRQALADNTSLGGSNTIVFSNIVTGTISLTSGELLIGKSVTILGPGAGILAVNGNAVSRVFDISSGLTVTIGGLTITNGSFAGGSGGGVYNYQSTVTISNCTIAGNTARRGGGIYNDHGSGAASLTVSRCALNGNTASYGGAIYNNALNYGNATLSVVSSTLDGNTAPYAGGIYNDSRSSGVAGVAIDRSFFLSNSAFYDGNIGGGVGGGVYNDAENAGDGTVSVTSSTFKNNAADDGAAINNNGYQGTAKVYVTTTTMSTNWSNGGAAISSSGFQGVAQVVVSASTFNGNESSGGFGTIYNDNTSFLFGDTIFNSPTFTTNIFKASGSVLSQGYNLCNDNGGGFFTQPTDITNVDPRLGPLRDNGGPTLTHALLQGSPAIDQGKRDAVSLLPAATDQRGVARVIDVDSVANSAGGDGSDIGAFEFNSPPLWIVRSGTNAVLSWPTNYGSFRLEASTNLIGLTGWATVGGAPGIVGNEYRQTNGPIIANEFFRLRSN